MKNIILKINLSLILFFCCTINIKAQNEGNIWYFGQGSGLDFNSCTPVVLTNGAIDGYEGCSTICDKITGQLLFYTNSDSVWSKNHVAMPNGNLIPSNNSIAQVIIIPKPQSNSLYYIFTNDEQAGYNWGFRYHVVDMTLNGGLGDVSSKDNMIYAPFVTEEVTAVKHSNGNDTWVIGHTCGSDTFFVFLVTNAGVSITPIKTKIGKIHQYNVARSNWDAIGEIKASPNGTKLAVTTYDQQDVELFDFNNSTGIISNQILLTEAGSHADTIAGNFSRLYGASFSPNNNILYASVGEVPAKIVQFDISSGNAATINASKQTVFTSTTSSTYDLKLAPNGKIYAGGQFRTDLGVINNPNIMGTGCNYVHNGINLNGKLSPWGLNNLIEQTNYCIETYINYQSAKDEVLFLFPNPNKGIFEFHVRDEMNNGQIFLINSLGQKVYEQKINQGTNNIQTRDLPKGLYNYILFQDSQTISNGKFVIE